MLAVVVPVVATLIAAVGLSLNVRRNRQRQTTRVAVAVKHRIGRAPGVINLNNIKMAPGHYEIEVRTTNLGERVEYVERFSIETVPPEGDPYEILPGASAFPVQPPRGAVGDDRPAEQDRIRPRATVPGYRPPDDRRRVLADDGTRRGDTCRVRAGRRRVAWRAGPPRSALGPHARSRGELRARAADEPSRTAVSALRPPTRVSWAVS